MFQCLEFHETNKIHNNSTKMAPEFYNLAGKYIPKNPEEYKTERAYNKAIKEYNKWLEKEKNFLQSLYKLSRQGRQEKYNKETETNTPTTTYT